MEVWYYYENYRWVSLRPYSKKSLSLANCIANNLWKQQEYIDFAEFDCIQALKTICSNSSLSLCLADSRNLELMTSLIESIFDERHFHLICYSHHRTKTFLQAFMEHLDMQLVYLKPFVRQIVEKIMKYCNRRHDESMRSQLLSFMLPALVKNNLIHILTRIVPQRPDESSERQTKTISLILHHLEQHDQLLFSPQHDT
eukprot:755540-Hanusia_phi.AAC.1